MKLKPSEIAFFMVIMILVTGLILLARSWQIQRQAAQKTFEPQVTEVQLPPPRQAQTGILSQVQGGVNLHLAVADVPQPASESATVTEGDVLATTTGSAQLTFPEFAILEAGRLTSFSFTSTKPDSFLVNQKSGSVTTSLLNPSSILSIRGLHFLLELQSGIVTTEIDDIAKTATITQSEGQSRLGQIDTENNTKTWTLGAGQQAMIDDLSRSVQIVPIK